MEPEPVARVTQAATGCAMQVVAHEDDDILFMSPDVLGDVRQGRCLRTVFVTAGDAGGEPAYWLGREAGARAAYAAMAARPNVWTTADAGISGHSIPVSTLQGADIQLVFLRLPDGCQEHAGCGTRYGGESMERLWLGTVPSSQTVDEGAAKSRYTKAELIGVLRQLMVRYAPALLRLQNYVDPIGIHPETMDGDHPDHHAAAYFGYEAHLGLANRPEVVGYYGYPTSDRPANVSGELLTAKRNVFMTYAAHDPGVCGGPCAGTPAMYESWIQRQYRLDANANALTRPRHAGQPRVMIVGDSISHGDNGNQTWRYRLHEHLKGLPARPDFVGPRRGPNTGTYPIGGWDDDHYAKWGCIAHQIVFPEQYGNDPPCDPGSSMMARVRQYRPDVMLVHLGSNDMGWGVSSPAGLRDTMRAFVERARREKPDIDIVFAQIGQVSLFRGNPLAAEFAPLIAQLAAAETRPWSRIAVAPVHPAWVQAIDADAGGTHPSVHGEFTIAKAFADTLHSQWGFGNAFGPIVAPPPAVTGHTVSPSSVVLTQPFTVSWPRVTNPGIWTTYKVQIRNHIGFGFGLIWESPPTPDLSVTYTGTLPQTGVYNIVVISTDGVNETMSAAIPLEVRGGPPPVTGIQLSPSAVSRGQPVTVSWPQVDNPGIWTTYKVQIRHHLGFGFGLVWESPFTPDIALTYTGTLPQSGVYHVVVVATDGVNQVPSSPVELQVRSGPPMVRNISLSPSVIRQGGLFTTSWSRVDNPGIWTWYRVEVHHHRAFGYGLVWSSPDTTDLTMKYGGPSLTPGVYHVVVVSDDGTGETPSQDVELTVNPN